MCVRLTVGLCKRSGRSGDSGAGCANEVPTNAQSKRGSERSVRLIFVFPFKACVRARAPHAGAPDVFVRRRAGGDFRTVVLRLNELEGTPSNRGTLSCALAVS